MNHRVILNAIQYFSEAMQDHFGADLFEHQVSFVSKIALVLLKMAGDSFQHYPNSHTLTDQYYHSLSSDSTMLVLRKLPVTSEPVMVLLMP